MNELLLASKRNTCLLCSKHFTKISSLKQHMLIHTGEMPYSCLVCEKQFSVKANLKRHILTHAKDRRERMRHQCSWCLKTFSQSSTLSQHVLIHSGEKPYACEICQRTFSVKSNLKKHLLIHTGEKPHICEICKQGFNHKISLTAHMTKHIGTEFKCEFCNSSFTRKSNMRNHMRKHTGEMPYLCVVCMQCFGQRSQLTAHLRKHAKESNIQSCISEIQKTSNKQLDCTQDKTINTSFSNNDSDFLLNHQKELNTCTKEMCDILFDTADNLLPKTLIEKETDKCHKFFSSSFVKSDTNMNRDNLVNTFSTAKTNFINPSAFNESCSDNTVKTFGNSLAIQPPDGLYKPRSTEDQNNSTSTSSAEKGITSFNHDISCQSTAKYDTFTIKYLRQYAKKKDKLHTCDVCKRSFKKSSNLTSHMRTHTGKMIFQCGVCEKWFYSKFNLERHFQTHSK